MTKLATYEYVLTKLLKDRLERYGYTAVCYRCGKPFKTGERILRKLRGRNSNKYYHPKCYASLFIEC